jgi:hypothetical protein
MNIRKLATLTALTGLTATPLAAWADGSERAAEACIQAFVEAHLPNHRAVQVRTVSPVSGSMSAYAKRHTIDLTAQQSRDGAVLVSARCVANAAGKVLELSSRSAAAGGAFATKRK